MKKLKKIGLMLLIIANISVVFAFWASGVLPAKQKAFAWVEIGSFDFFDCSKKIFVVDNNFYDKFFVLENNIYKWRDNISQEEIEEINQITKNYDFIKRDMIYKIKQRHYHLRHNDLPFKTTTHLSWAVEPVAMEVVAGWAYEGGRVISFEGEFFKVLYYVDGTPRQHPYTWQKINKLTEKDLGKYENSCVTNFYSIKDINKIRPYIYSVSTFYEIEDTVEFGGEKFVCVVANKGKNPINITFWQRI